MDAFKKKIERNLKDDRDYYEKTGSLKVLLVRFCDRRHSDTGVGDPIVSMKVFDDNTFTVEPTMCAIRPTLDDFAEAVRRAHVFVHRLKLKEVR